MTITLPLDQMTAEEKLQLIDILWESLEQNPDDIPVPEWHREILREREALIEAGDEGFISLEELKQHMQDLVK